MGLTNTSSFCKELLHTGGVLITLTNRNGYKALFTNYGARWVSMFTPDRYGKQDDILLGFDTLSGYIQAGEQYHGAIVGRVCGRISNASFSLDGKKYQLSSNDVYGDPVKNHLHGGVNAFHNRYWEYTILPPETEKSAVTFTLFSADGEEGYPGNIRIQVTYTLHADNTLSMECRGTTDTKTLLNITNHAFFNLHPQKTTRTLNRHIFQLNAPYLIECDEQLVPTGKLLPVKNTYTDFLTPHLFGTSIEQGDSQVKKDNGYSLAYQLQSNGEKVNYAACLYEAETGRGIRIYTNQPSIQLYNGYFMDGTDMGKNNTPYESGCGLAIETQGFPNAIHHSYFPSIIVTPDKEYIHYTCYRFFVQ